MRVTVDHPQGVTFELLENVSRRMSRRLDETDPIAGPYQIECESPGLNRRLRNLSDCRRFLGSSVRLKTLATAGNQRNFRGRISDVSDDSVLIELEDASVHWFEWTDVSDLHLDPQG